MALFGLEWKFRDKQIANRIITDRDIVVKTISTAAISTICLTLAACQPMPESSSVIARQNAEYDRQLQKVNEQQARAEAQIEKSEEQQKRMEILLERWEKQADRYDAILTRWEQGSGAPAFRAQASRATSEEK